MTPLLDLGEVYGTPVFTLTGVTSNLQSVYGALYNGKLKQWLFPAFWPVHRIVLTDLQKNFTVLPRSARLDQHLQNLETYKFPDTFTYITQPYQHQQEGLEHIHRNLRAGLFYDPGLGKCKIVVDLQRLTQDSFLILCPKVMLSTWAEEFVKHGNITDTLVLRGTKPKKLKLIQTAQDAAPAAVITTYETAALYANELLKINYSGIIADESHYLKTSSAKRTQAATALASRAYRRVLLSGTPSVGSPFDVYGQLRFLGKYFCPEPWISFRKMFGVFPKYEAHEAYPKIVIGYKNLEIINERVNLVGKRKTKEECLDLPERQIIDVFFNLEKSQVITYNDFIDNQADYVGIGIRGAITSGEINYKTGVKIQAHVLAPEAITVLGKLDQINSGFLYTTTVNPGLCNDCPSVVYCTDQNVKPYTSRCNVIQAPPEKEVTVFKENARLEQCQSLLESLTENPSNKVIIWSVYIEELDQIENVVKELALPYVRVQGGLTSQELDLQRQTFEKDPTCRVYLGQASTGIGITLNAANYVIYYNLPWSLQHYLQSIDRNYRIGQDKKVTVYRLIARHTLDESKAAALDQKISFADLVTNSTICATCSDYALRCSKFKIRPFGELCKFSGELAKELLAIRKIPNASKN